MTTTTPNGLVSFAGEEAVAANDDRAEATGSWKIPQFDQHAGWDPYEVWRTRVKRVRETPQPKPDEHEH